MKSLVFDSGPLISLTMNNLLWIFEPLKSFFRGDFYLPASVKSELIDDPRQTKKFRFESLQVQELVNKGILSIYDDRKTKADTLVLLQAANSAFSIKGKNLKILHYAEVSSLVAASQLESAALVIDERITRELVEHPMHLAKLMGRKLNSHVDVDRQLISRFREKTADISIIRSSELAAVAYEKKLFDRFACPGTTRKQVLESILWGLKLDGCAINERGIKAILNATS
ncbi:hypothetical protein HYX10_01105 [Candidatus Woesearchaeota archaeon]|nr:hypothetical protein [Candidatus Woesearchaeota archaeon]